MKQIIILLFSLIIVSIFNSCSDEINPVSPSPISKNNNYLGGNGTERTYKVTENWLNVSSNLPYFSVPDSLLAKVSLSTDQLQNGIAVIRDYTEFVEEIGELFYTSWELPLPRDNYLQSAGDGIYYRLSDELDSLMLNKTYSAGNYGIGTSIYKITNDEIITVHPSNREAINPSCTYIENNIQIGDTWVIWKHIDTTSNYTIQEKIVEVIGKENIVVTAGSFTAFKIKLSSIHYNTNIVYDLGYEYYVPNVGLVLKESDMNIFQWDSSTNRTIHFRQIIRKELVSYNFVQ